MAERDFKEAIIHVPGNNLPSGAYLDYKVSDDELWSALCGTFSKEAVIVPVISMPL